MVHGDEALNRAIRASQILFGQEISGLSVSEVLDIFDDVPSTQLAKRQFESDGVPLLELVKICGFASTNGEARRLVEGGGVYVNNHRMSDAQTSLDATTLLQGEILVMRKGAREYHLIQVQ